MASGVRRLGDRAVYSREETMADITGNRLLAKSLRHEGVTHLFFLSGGPMDNFYLDAEKEGIKLYDTRHEQAAAMMAHAWSRATGETGVCAACSGPGATNLVTGVVTAFTDACPIVALGGSSNSSLTGWEDFQEIDQVSIFRPITKWSGQVNKAERMPELVSFAFRKAWGNRPGPVYLDLPGDVLHERVDEANVQFPVNSRTDARILGDPDEVKRAIELLSKAERPLVLSGTGVMWSKASKEIQDFVEATGIPFYTTPQSRGVIPEDNDLSFPAARLDGVQGSRCRVGGRHQDQLDMAVPAGPTVCCGPEDYSGETRTGKRSGTTRRRKWESSGMPRWCSGSSPEEAKEQKFANKKDSDWISRLQAKDAANNERSQPILNSDQMPMHPLRMMKEIREFLPRDAMLVVDGHETLNFGRQTIPTYYPGHRINSGASGCMGVGLPFGLASALAKPDKKTLVIHGDGSFGINAINIDTAVRHNIPLVCVVNVNGGWASGRKGDDVLKTGIELGFEQRYDKLGEALGAHGEYVTKPEELKPALQRAFDSGKPAIVNVITDRWAASTTQNFQPYDH